MGSGGVVRIEASLPVPPTRIATALACPSSMIIDEDCVPTGSRRYGGPRDGWSMVGDNVFNHSEDCQSKRIHCEVLT